MRRARSFSKPTCWTKRKSNQLHDRKCLQTKALKWVFCVECYFTIQSVRRERVLFTSAEAVISLSCFLMSDQDSSHAGLMELHFSSFFYDTIHSWPHLSFGKNAKMTLTLDGLNSERAFWGQPPATEKSGNQHKHINVCKTMRQCR